MVNGVPETQKVAVHGVVLDSVSHQPIARALVDGSSDAVLTDNEGKFEMTLPEGYANLQVRRPGYTSPSPDMRFIRVSSTTPALTFYLTPSASVSGRVSLNGDDDPSMIRIAAYRKVVTNGHEMWNQMEFIATDSDGTFRFVGLAAPGSYIFCNTAGNEPGPQHGKLMGFPSMCFPGGTDFSSVTPLELAAGQQAQLEVNLELQQFFSVTISVPDTDHMPGIRIHDRDGFPVPGPPIRSRTPGTMEFRLPNGSYYAEARANGPERTYGRVDFTVANGPLKVSMSLQTLQPIPVVIHRDFADSTNKDSQPVMQASAEADVNPGMQLMLQPEGNVMTGGGGGLRHVNGGGPEAFEMEASPGRWRAQANSYEGYVSSMTSGTVDLMRAPLVIGPSGSAQPIEVTLRNDGGRLKCTLAGANSANPADDTADVGMYNVVAIAQFPAAMPIQEMSALSGQSAMIGNLAPGDYRVAAFDGRPSIDLDDKDGLSRMMAGAQTVHVEAHGTATVQLSLTRLSGAGAAE